MHDVIENKLVQILEVCRLCRVKTLYLFGSATSDKFNRDSDVDLLVDFPEELSTEAYTEYYFKLEEMLSALLGRTIDLTTERSVRNPYFRRELERTKQLLYRSSPVPNA